MSAPGDLAPAPPITTRRLSLVLLEFETLQALESRDLPGACERQGLALPPDFVAFDGTDDAFLRFQQHWHRAEPGLREWCARAMVRRDDGAVVGRCGFHGPPRGVGRAEIGYFVVPSHRGQGFTSEAASALVSWAWRKGERTVFASVGPDNAPSLAIVRKLGFVQTGVQMDPIDGEELVFEISQET